MIEQKKFDELESLWMKRLETGPLDVDDFLSVAKALRKAEEKSRSEALVSLLSDTLKERGLWPARLKVLKEVGRLSKHPNNFRAPLEEALSKTYGSRPSFKKAMTFAKFNEPASNPIERSEKVENWLTYDEGECFFMAGRGAGQSVELNPDLGVCRIDFEKDKRVSIPIGAALKHLIPLPEGHILREKFKNPGELRTKALASPADTFARILQSFGRPMAVSEVRDALIGIVPEEKWGSWWTAARKNPQIVVGGTGSKATYSWNASSGEADHRIRLEFDRADPKGKLDLAKKHSQRSGDLADYFSTSLTREAERLSKTSPALAWEIATVLEKLPGKYETTINFDDLLSGAVSARVIGAVHDRALRERALATVRKNNPEWPKVYAEMFFIEDDPRILSLIVDALTESGDEGTRDRLIDETVRYPRRHTKAFYWYCKRLSEMETLPDKANHSLVNTMLEAISSEEFGALRPRFREFFDKGELGIRIIQKSLTEEHARKLVEILERYGSLEEYRRENIRTAALMKYPTLREPQVEPFYATAEALATKRGELEHLVKVELPANSKAIQVAREMGDLRENFEYKAARQRAEYLSARVGELQSEITRVRVIEPAQVDASQVRIGTRVELRNGDVRREVTILGPWESAPEHGIYSNLSEAAKALLGKKTGDLVAFMGNDYEITAVARWK